MCIWLASRCWEMRTDKIIEKNMIQQINGKYKEDISNHRRQEEKHQFKLNK